MNPKMTVVTICYNCIVDLKKTLQSVIEQEEDDFEYLVIDGGSIDGVTDYLSEVSDSRIKWISEPDYGISDAFNKGIRMAKGEYICFLNAGDTFLNNVTMTYIKEKLVESGTDVVFFQAKMNDGLLMPHPMYQDNEKIIWQKSKIPHQAAWVKREVFEQIGFFNIFLKIRMDFDFFIRCRKFGCSYCYIKHPVVMYDTNGISSRKDYKILNTKEGFAIKLYYNETITYKDIAVLLKRYIFG